MENPVRFSVSSAGGFDSPGEDTYARTTTLKIGQNEEMTRGRSRVRTPIVVTRPPILGPLASLACQQLNLPEDPAPPRREWPLPSMQLPSPCRPWTLHRRTARGKLFPPGCGVQPSSVRCNVRWALDYSTGGKRKAAAEEERFLTCTMRPTPEN